MIKKNNIFANYFKPSIYVRSFNDVSINSLKKQGIKLFICDLDNTLVPHYKRTPTKLVIEFAKAIEKNGIKFVILSNNTNLRVTSFCKMANIHEYIGAAKKPMKSKILKIIKKYQVERNEIIIMGDQLITDILLANRLKIESILVQPLVSTDYKMNKFNIFLEKYIYKKLEKKNILKKGSYNSGRLKNNFEIL